MARRYMFSAEKIKQKSAKAVYYTLWSNSPCKYNNKQNVQLNLNHMNLGEKTNDVPVRRYSGGVKARLVL
jgi:ABC-type multidrug transport system ATPase subunit